MIVESLHAEQGNDLEYIDYVKQSASQFENGVEESTKKLVHNLNEMVAKHFHELKEYENQYIKILMERRDAANAVAGEVSNRLNESEVTKRVLLQKMIGCVQATATTPSGTPSFLPRKNIGELRVPVDEPVQLFWPASTDEPRPPPPHSTPFPGLDYTSKSLEPREEGGGPAAYPAFGC